MTEEEKKLAQCPFCGGKGHLMLKKAIYHGQNYFGDKDLTIRAYVYCGRCKARGGVVSVRTITDSMGNMGVGEQKKLRLRAYEKWSCRNIEVNDDRRN